MTTESYRTDLDADGVLSIVWDMPGRSMNVRIASPRLRPARSRLAPAQCNIGDVAVKLRAV